MPQRRSWGTILADFPLPRRLPWIDLLMVVGIAGAILGSFSLGRQWTQELRPSIEIDLDNPWILIKYTFFSLSRGLIAYALSLAFTLVYGYWAAKDAVAERVLVPLLDILQSIPVLSFLPGVMLAMMGLFPTSNVGLELAVVLLIFAGQAWNITFSYYHSLKSVPQDQREVATIYRLGWWQRLKWVELPFATMGLVWNSMMSMAGGWFFLTVCEAFRLKDRDFRVPGLGSYVSVAVDQGRLDSMFRAVIAMVLMIVLLDQLLWRPVVVWAQKFRLEEGGGSGPAMTSWFLRWLRRSKIVAYVTGLMSLPSFGSRSAEKKMIAPNEPDNRSILATIVSYLAFLSLIGVLLWGAWQVFELLKEVSTAEWSQTLKAAWWTLLRVVISTAIGTLWAVPAGLAIGLSPNLSRLLQPVIQVAASFPAPMLFPVVIVVLSWFGVSIGVGSIVLMLMGTQWYILFNVVAGSMAVPADLREAARSFNIRGWLKFTRILIPAIFPYLVTGWVTAAGGAWNASIVAEYVPFRGQTLKAFGLGALISEATEAGNNSLLAAATLVLALLVVLFNRTIWRWCYRLAQTRFSLDK